MRLFCLICRVFARQKHSMNYRDFQKMSMLLDVIVWKECWPILMNFAMHSAAVRIQKWFRKINAEFGDWSSFESSTSIIILKIAYGWMGIFSLVIWIPKWSTNEQFRKLKINMIIFKWTRHFLCFLHYVYKTYSFQIPANHLDAIMILCSVFF